MRGPSASEAVSATETMKEFDDLLNQAFSYWKFKQSDALGGALSELTAKLEILFHVPKDDFDRLARYSVSSIISSFCKNLVDRRTKQRSGAILDTVRHSLEIKCSTLEAFILFLKDTTLFSYVDEMERLYICGLFERLVGLQNLRHFHLLCENLFESIIVKVLKKYSSTSYGVSDDSTILNSDESIHLFYDKVSVSPLYICTLVEYLKQECQEYSDELYVISVDKCLSVPFLQSVLEIIKIVRGYLSAILTASEGYAKELEIRENAFLEEYNKFDCVNLHKPLANASLDWVISADFEGQAMLHCMIEFVALLTTIFGIAMQREDMVPNSASGSQLASTKEFYQTLYFAVEASFAVCAHVLEMAFCLFCLSSPIDAKFVQIKSQLFPNCKKLEQFATAALNKLNGLNGVCGLDYTLELAQKYLDIPTLVEIAVWNDLNENIDMYSVERLTSQMLDSTLFKDLLFEYFVTEDTHRYLLYRLPYTLTNDAYRYLEGNPRLRWPLLMRLSQLKSELTDFTGGPDWVDIIVGYIVDTQQPDVLQDMSAIAASSSSALHYPKAIERAFLDMYAVGMGSEDVEERMFYLCLAKAAGKGGGIEIPNYAIASQQCASNNAFFIGDVLENDVDYEILITVLQAEILEGCNIPMKSMEVVSEILKKLDNSKLATSKERRQHRNILRDIALLLPRLILSGIRKSVFNMFWKLVLEVDTQLWEKLYSVDDVATEFSNTDALHAQLIDGISHKRKSMALNLCQHSLLYELLVKFDWGILRHKHSGDIRSIADGVHPRLASLVEHCFVLYDRYRADKKRFSSEE